MQTARVAVAANQGIAVGIKKQQLRRESARQIIHRLFKNLR
ncbi:Uncharacterised protein [Salmonella enterica subsp. enterica serovar Typhi]|nr:Uncharacterised protein [Salmonella enterica subsp. enterica serovar Typhi]CHK31470.1 Uncharacterised protein [Salmonella enterica subsp. enterica serovar Typhi]CNV23530.1 Uncharacterised protein [Salmonella enterica subsp. enterica serovar Bovismorbificans]